MWSEEKRAKPTEIRSESPGARYREGKFIEQTQRALHLVRITLKVSGRGEFSSKRKKS